MKQETIGYPPTAKCILSLSRLADGRSSLCHKLSFFESILTQLPIVSSYTHDSEDIFSGLQNCCTYIFPFSVLCTFALFVFPDSDFYQLRDSITFCLDFSLLKLNPQKYSKLYIQRIREFIELKTYLYFMGSM